jgi:hypothetical protein
MFGEFFAVRRAETNCSGVRGKSLEILRWEHTQKAYIITDFDDDGVYSEFAIKVNGPTWSLVDAGVSGGKKFWTRCSWTSPDGNRIVQTCNDSSDGKKWTLREEGLFEKVRP